MPYIAGIVFLVVALKSAAFHKLPKRGSKPRVPFGLKKTVGRFDYAVRAFREQTDFEFSARFAYRQRNFVAIAVGKRARHGHSDGNFEPADFSQSVRNALALEFELSGVGKVLKIAPAALAVHRTNGLGAVGRGRNNRLQKPDVELRSGRDDLRANAFAAYRPANKYGFAVYPRNAFAFHTERRDIRFDNVVFFELSRFVHNYPFMRIYVVFCLFSGFYREKLRKTAENR